MGFAKDVTVIVPTLNRSDFLAAMMRAFRDIGFEGTLLIGDSSTPDHFERTARSIRTLGDRYQVVQKAFPGLKGYQCIARLIPLIRTPYALYMCDDDILVPSALDDCARFLDTNPSYSAAGGAAVILSIQPGGKVVNAGRYSVGSAEAETGSQRLFDLMAHYTVVAYSLSRTEQMVKRFQPTVSAALTDVAFAAEVLPTCMHVVQGKVKMLDRLFVVRQNHTQRYLEPQAFDWITKNDWPSSYAVFHDCLVQALVEQDRISIQEAQAIVKQAFWLFLQRRLAKKWKSHYERSDAGWRSQLRETARRSPALRKIWSVVRSVIPGAADKMSLPALLHPSSPYHADFLPIYKTITSVSESGPS